MTNKGLQRQKIFDDFYKIDKTDEGDVDCTTKNCANGAICCDTFCDDESDCCTLFIVCSALIPIHLLCMAGNLSYYVCKRKIKISKDEKNRKILLNKVKEKYVVNLIDEYIG